MELTIEILKNLIKEETERVLSEQMSQAEAAENLSVYLSRMMGEMGAESPGQLDTVYNNAKQLITQSSGAANRKDVQEACGDMQSIDMEVEPDHHEEDHEGSMAKRQMFKTAQYAADIFDMIEDGQEFPAWIQSKMTKIADYIGAVKHYLEYDEVMDVPGNRSEKKWSDADHDKQEKIAKEIEKDNPGISKQKKMAFAGAQVNREKRKRNK